MKTKAHCVRTRREHPLRNATHATRPLAAHRIAVSHRARPPTASIRAPSHDEALARLEYLVDARRRLGVLLGESGVGKSLVLRVAARAACAEGLCRGHGRRRRRRARATCSGSWPRRSAPRRATRPTWSTSGGSWPIASPRTACSKRTRCSWSTTRARPGRTCSRNSCGSRGSTPRLPPAGRSCSPPSRRRRPAGANRSASWWICESSSNRGAKPTRSATCRRRSSKQDGSIPCSTTTRLAAIYDLTGGVPRRVIRLADLALVAGAAATVERIDAATVHDAHGEMSWPTAAAY